MARPEQNFPTETMGPKRKAIVIFDDDDSEDDPMEPWRPTKKKLAREEEEDDSIIHVPPRSSILPTPAVPFDMNAMFASLPFTPQVEEPVVIPATGEAGGSSFTSDEDAGPPEGVWSDELPAFSEVSRPARVGQTSR